MNIDGASFVPTHPNNVDLERLGDQIAELGPERRVPKSALPPNYRGPLALTALRPTAAWRRTERAAPVIPRGARRLDSAIAP